MTRDVQSTPHYDLVVIGSGQGGNPLASEFAHAGKRVALVEREHIGGTCINDGCSPTKTMIASARVAHVARRACEYGVHSGDVSVDLRRVRARKAEIVERFRQGSERGLADSGVDVLRGQATFVGERTLAVRGLNPPVTLTAETVVINTGLAPAIPDIHGLDTVAYLTSTSVMELDHVPEQLIVMGGGYVGVEFAQMFRRFGSAVTLIQRDEQLLSREDRDVADEVAAILAADGVDIIVGADVVGVSAVADGVRVDYRVGRGSSLDMAPRELRGSQLLVATGRTPNSGDLGLAAAGVATDERGYIRVNERLETTARGVYAIGDVKGGPAFTHISYDDFRVLRANLLNGGNATIAGRLVPYTVFIDPQLGRIGLTEKEATAKGLSVRVATLPMSSVARALEIDETHGFMKALVDEQSGMILGAAVLGVEGGEIAALFQLAMMGRLHYSALRDGVFSHPTIAEALNNIFTAMDRAS